MVLKISPFSSYEVFIMIIHLIPKNQLEINPFQLRINTYHDGISTDLARLFIFMYTC